MVQEEYFMIEAKAVREVLAIDALKVEMEKN